MATVAQPQVTKSIKVDANLAPILDTMLKKAGIKLDDVSDTFIRIWINQNLDLLNEDDKKKFNLKNQMGEAIQKNVFVDTNVLINDFFYRIYNKATGKPASLAIQFLKSKPKVELYIASFALVQLISTLDKAKVSKEKIADELHRILSRYKLVDLTAKDFEKALKTEYKDTEDAVQYILCRKTRCFYILTDNVKDFATFEFIATIKPKSIRKIII